MNVHYTCALASHKSFASNKDWSCVFLSHNGCNKLTTILTLQLTTPYMTKYGNMLNINKFISLTYRAAHAKNVLELWPQFPSCWPLVFKLNTLGVQQRVKYHLYNKLSINNNVQSITYEMEQNWLCTKHSNLGRSCWNSMPVKTINYVYYSVW